MEESYRIHILYHEDCDSWDSKTVNVNAGRGERSCRRGARKSVINSEQKCENWNVFFQLSACHSSRNVQRDVSGCGISGNIFAIGNLRVCKFLRLHLLA